MEARGHDVVTFALTPGHRVKLLSIWQMYFCILAVWLMSPASHTYSLHQGASVNRTGPEPDPDVVCPYLLNVQCFLAKKKQNTKVIKSKLFAINLSDFESPIFQNLFPFVRNCFHGCNGDICQWTDFSSAVDIVPSHLIKKKKSCGCLKISIFSCSESTIALNKCFYCKVTEWKYKVQSGSTLF